MLKKALLLNFYYEIESFISEKKVLKFIVNNKVEVITEWDDVIRWSSGEMKYPAVVKLIKPFRKNFYSFAFSRNAIIKRDNSHCQYCNKKLTSSQVTIDHVVPRSQGGGNSFTNCVTSCQFCNAYKGNRTPEEAGMQLIVKPEHPSSDYNSIIPPQETWHPSWDQFVNFP